MPRLCANSPQFQASKENALVAEKLITFVLLLQMIFLLQELNNADHGKTFHDLHDSQFGQAIFEDFCYHLDAFQIQTAPVPPPALFRVVSLYLHCQESLTSGVCACQSGISRLFGSTTSRRHPEFRLPPTTARSTLLLCPSLEHLAEYILILRKSLAEVCNC